MDTSTEGPNHDEHSYGMTQLRYQHAVLVALSASSQGLPIPPEIQIVLQDLIRQLGENAMSALE